MLEMNEKKVWKDTNENPIQAHGGCMIMDNGKYYWFGENKNGPTIKRPGQYERVDAIGISCYSSDNLTEWKNEGLVLKANIENEKSDIHTSKIIERPKVVYCEKTKKFVMWLHIDTSDYKKAAAGFAISDKITGPYEYVRSIKPNGFDSRDMTIFKDDDGKCFLFHSGDWNKTMYISELNDEYTDITGAYIKIFEGLSREAPAVFKRKGKYYLITSGCTGWEPNEAQYAISDNVMGKWTIEGNPCFGTYSNITFGAQSTFVIKDDKGLYIFMADIWNPENLSESRYLWLPIEFNKEKIEVKFDLIS